VCIRSVIQDGRLIAWPGRSPARRRGTGGNRSLVAVAASRRVPRDSRGLGAAAPRRRRASHRGRLRARLRPRPADRPDVIAEASITEFYRDERPGTTRVTPPGLTRGSLWFAVMLSRSAAPGRGAHPQRRDPAPQQRHRPLVTRTVRGIPSEVALDGGGFVRGCVASCDNIHTIPTPG